MKNLYKVSLLLITIISFFLILSCGGATVKRGEDYIKKLPNGGEVNGPRSIENIEENIQMLVPRFNHFFKKRLRINPDLKGTIEFILDIDADGEVIYSSIGKSTTNDPDFDDEILHAISLHKFGEWTQGRGKTEVLYPYTFSQEEIEPAQKGGIGGDVKPPETKPFEMKPPETQPSEAQPAEESSEIEGEAPEEKVDFNGEEETEEEEEASEEEVDF